MFCKYEGCVHYSKATKYPRACYYEPQCWRGYLDILLTIIKIKKDGRNKIAGS